MTFSQVSGASEDGYLADSWNASDYSGDYLQRGFITRYAQHSDREDFAECMSVYVTRDASWWANALAEAKGADKDGSAKLSTKMGIVKAYMLETFNIDLDALRETILRRQAEVMAGLVDLHSVEIY